MKPGTRVYYHDDIVDEIGVVVQPNNDELRSVQMYADEGMGPEHGDVMVEWPYGRYWESPNDLTKVDGDED